MKQERKASNFERCNLNAFGFKELPLGNNSDVHEILKYFNGGFKLNYTRDEDDTDTAKVQGGLL